MNVINVHGEKVKIIRSIFFSPYLLFVLPRLFLFSSFIDEISYYLAFVSN